MSTVKQMFLLFILLKFGFVSNAQIDSLKLYDLAVMREFPRPDTAMKTQQQDSVTVSVLFKLNHPEQASKVTVQLGSAKDNGDIRNGHYTVTQQNNTYFLNIDGTPNKIWGKSGVSKYQLNKQDHQNLIWVTAFAEDKNGLITEKKYFRCK